MPSSKPQYILDECVSIKLSYLGKMPKHLTFIESRDVLGKGASDEAIFEYAKKHKLMIVTRDMEFAEKVLAEGYSVLLLLLGNRWGVVSPTKHVTRLEEALFDKCTLSLMKKQHVVLP